MTRVWIDVEDLFQYAAGLPRPSGIQRLAFELMRALVARPDAAERVRFVRHDPRRDSFGTIPWSDVAALFAGMVTTPRPAPARRGRIGDRRGPMRRFIGRLGQRMPFAVREALSQGLRTQLATLGTLLRALKLQGEVVRLCLRALAAALRSPPSGPDAPLPPGAGEAFAAEVRPGDILFAPGSPWWEYYPRLVRGVKEAHGLRLALLLYDLVPVLHPEWCDRTLVNNFAAWIASALPQADLVLAISQSTAHDVEAYAARKGIALAAPVRPIPIGAGFSTSPVAASPAPGLPEPGSYVLFVSTIEARKNHALLFRVWERLLHELPRDAVPRLVFAGRIGWLVTDLMQQLDNTNWLDGHVVLIKEPADADLSALYRGCLFTVYPSLYEGWGLPVTESFVCGKPCVIATGSSLPEAGGTLARYFDPNDLNDAVRVIRGAFEDRAALAAWEARVRAEFRPVSWSASAEAVLAALEGQGAPRAGSHRAS